jgi:hypothetical protein
MTVPRIILAAPGMMALLQRSIGADLSPGERLLWIAMGRPFLG